MMLTHSDSHIRHTFNIATFILGFKIIGSYSVPKSKNKRGNK